MLKKICGINNVLEIIHNPNYDVLFREETQQNLKGLEKCNITELGAVNVLTGIYTGRSPKDKYIVFDNLTKNSVWWDSDNFHNDNHPVDVNVWNMCKKIATDQLSNKKIFIVDAFCGANKNNRIAVRFITEVAWQAHFVTNMFIKPNKDELKDFTPFFTVYCASKAKILDYKKLGLNSETAILFNLSSREQVILNTWYCGEMKKGIFSVMNYYLPKKGVLSMHCAANTDFSGKDTALFFGLSGTGKTTLSADPNRLLIGDDEHSWDVNGIFNLEGGCYAKVINLDKEVEPFIYRAIKRNALLENVSVDKDGRIDFFDKTITENTRVSYPINHIKNIKKPYGIGPHAKKIIFLTCDAYGVFPPVSILSNEQIEYYFLSGYTSKVAGTERGIVEPVPTFSACFGQPFLLLNPKIYAKLLQKYIKKFNAECYLVNTGWNGTGNRISISNTRKIIDAILNNSINTNEAQIIPVFNLKVPLSVMGVKKQILDPRESFSSKSVWIKKANLLLKSFEENYKKFI